MSGNYYDGLNEKLFNTLPPANRVLEIGCANGNLGYHYKQKYPNAEWIGIDIMPDAVKTAAPKLDKTLCLSIEDCDLPAELGNFDLFVMGDVIEHLRNPYQVLQYLHERQNPGAKLCCCVPNLTHYSVIERMLLGEMVYDKAGLLDETHVRVYSQISLFKMLIDCAWLPNLADHYSFSHPDPVAQDAINQAAMKLGMSEAEATRNMSYYQMIVQADAWDWPVLEKHKAAKALQKSEKSQPAKKGQPAKKLQPIEIMPATAEEKALFSVVVPVNNASQYHFNIMLSPGLKEVQAQIQGFTGASHPGEALQTGLATADSDWILFCHQDVYFPNNFGKQLNDFIRSIEPQNAADTLCGFIGFGIDLNSKKIYNAGSIINQQDRLHYRPAQSAITFDEVAILIHKNSSYQLDPQLGWHLWATDLCLQAAAQKKLAHVHILQCPFYHNARRIADLPEAFHRSEQYLQAKYPQIHRVPSLCLSDHLEDEFAYLA